MNNLGQTIEIYLPDGEPRGLRLAGITTRIVQAMQVPRTKLDRLFARPEANRVALYFLFGPAADGIKPVVYIGQTEDLTTRLKKHNVDKDYWSAAVVVTSKSESFTQVHVRYLEWMSIDKAATAGRYSLKNGNAGGKPYIPEPLEADVFDVFDTASTLLATLGFPIFEAPAAEMRDPAEVFYCQGKHADGKGAPVDDGFVLFKGSICRRESVPSAAASTTSMVEELCAVGLLAPQNEDQLVLTEDYVCSSPSAAASIVLARSANGWAEWKDASGRSLDEVYRKPDAQSVAT
ncbi:hypothetical protein Mal64_29980 [Pseudobythopirellula maris]|uniref:DUF4357 domain-containing protein n=1 Tax=Pseudobythopirellula maris TaxID=2527991 RepID=A0A5C5ZJC7_9BACT|nr:GIY-YIG nuclease family protein [Pseudobythopirellula maris]TWT87459.1 hypothetical protein Mal64_29980 [Pseudobythopirellula maris]